MILLLGPEISCRIIATARPRIFKVEKTNDKPYIILPLTYWLFFSPLLHSHTLFFDPWLFRLISKFRSFTFLLEQLQSRIRPLLYSLRMASSPKFVHDLRIPDDVEKASENTSIDPVSTPPHVETEYPSGKVVALIAVALYLAVFLVALVASSCPLTSHTQSVY